MSHKLTVSWLHNSEEWLVEAEMNPPEHDVGIMHPYPDSWKITDSRGAVVELDELPPELYDVLIAAWYGAEP